MHQVQRFEQGRGNWDRAVDAAPALFEALEGDGAVGVIDAICRQRERFADTASGEVQHMAEGADFPRRAVGGSQEHLALFCGQVFAVARAVVQLSGHAQNPFLNSPRISPERASATLFISSVAYLR